ncbi:MAG: ABC transporter ATP-binding protein [Oscillospiraceae bacterium]
MQFEVTQLTKSFGEKQVLKGIGFKTQSGKAFGLLGRNGAGKTTTIRIVMGVFPADSGQVLLDGKPINHAKTDIGYLPEEHGLYPKIKIGEQLAYLAELRGVSRRHSKASIAHWMARLEMQAFTNRKLDTLSKGNQQKIQLVAALVTNPDFVILDEPFSGLDPVNAALLKDVVKELIAQGKIVLFSSHQMNYVEEFCDAIAILHQGEIVLSGEIDAIKRSYDRSVMVVHAQNLAAVAEVCRGKLSDMVRSVDLRENLLLARLAAPGEKLPFMAALAQQGIDVDSVAVFEPSLNDIFVQYTGDDKADDTQEVPA